LKVEFTPKQVLKFLLCIITFLFFIHSLSLISRLLSDHGTLFGELNIFNVDAEKNIPTFYSAIALLIASTLLFFITATHKKMNDPYISWAILAILFLFLSIDEISSIHESLTLPTRNLFDTSGLLYFAWVIPYGIALIIFVCAYLKFLLSLPKHIMILFITSGIIFIMGAIGFELLGGREAELNGKQGLLYAIFYTCEEFFEMIGIALFIYTLLTYIVTQFGSLKIIASELID